jgi:hypothetical protein
MDKDKRSEYIKAVHAEFCKIHGRRAFTSVEWDLAWRWADGGIPLSAALQGIREAGDKIRTLHGCEQSVKAQMGRRANAGMLEKLPEPMLLDKSWESEWDAQKARDERARLFKKYGRE